MNEKLVLDKLVDHFVREMPADNLFSIFDCDDTEHLVVNSMYVKYYDRVYNFYTEIKKHQDSLYHCMILIQEEKNSKLDKEIDNEIPINVVIIDKIIKKGIYTSWTPELREKYNMAFDMIIVWKDFFFSYTNRNAYATNVAFESFIHSHISPDEAPISSSREGLVDQSEINYLARVLVRLLESQGLRSFYDYKSLRCGDDIEEEVLKYCKKAFTFVQLIEMILFVPPDSKENWCYREFEEFDKHCSAHIYNKNFKRHFFCLCKKDIEPVELHQSYTDWLNKVNRLLYMNIEDASYQCRCEAITIKKILIEIHKLAVEIKSAKDDIIESTLLSLCS